MTGRVEAALGDATPFAAALRFAAHGWPIFACHSSVDDRCTCGAPACSSPGKHPRTAHGLKDATTDVPTIRSWWSRWPDANVAIRTGRESGLVVLDADAHKGGIDALGALQARHQPLPKTVKVLTGGGGLHFYFRHPGSRVANSAGRLGPGLDIRGDGGYVIAPPSRHVSGSGYQWASDSAETIAPLPAWLLELLRASAPANEVERAGADRLDTAEVLAGVPEGRRDATLFRYACRLRAKDLARVEAERLVLEAARHCQPAFSPDVAREKVARAWRYPPGRAAEMAAADAARASEDGGAEAPWDAPVPFAHLDLPPFPTDALPVWLRAFVEAEAEATQTPPDLAGLLGLSVVAAAVAKRPVLEVREGWREPLNIFTVTVLPPGNRKTTVFETMAAPLATYEAAEATRLAPLIAEKQAAYQIAEAALRRAQEAAAKADGEERDGRTAEAAEQARALVNLRVPVAPRYVADDCSPERLATLLRDQGGWMAVLSSEGDVFDLMAGRYSSTGAPNFGVYLRGHAGDTLRVDRVGRPPEYVQAPALTVGLAV